jgi:hypothetical protein
MLVISTSLTQKKAALSFSCTPLSRTQIACSTATHQGAISHQKLPPPLLLPWPPADSPE